MLVSQTFIKIFTVIETIATTIGLLVISIILTALLRYAIILLCKAWTYLWAYIFCIKNIIKEKRIKK